eukprot:RCo019581
MDLEESLLEKPLALSSGGLTLRQHEFLHCLAFAGEVFRYTIADPQFSPRYTVGMVLSGLQAFRRNIFTLRVLRFARGVRRVGRWFRRWLATRNAELLKVTESWVQYEE